MLEGIVVISLHSYRKHYQQNSYRSSSIPSKKNSMNEHLTNEQGACFKAGLF